MLDNKWFLWVELKSKSKEFWFTSQPPKPSNTPDILKKWFTSQPPKTNPPVKK